MSQMKTNLDLQNDLVHAQKLLLGCTSFLEDAKVFAESKYDVLTIERLISQIKEFTTK